MKNDKDANPDLDVEGNKLVTMYVTARQFKNAILEEEMVVFPANSHPEGTILDIGGAKIYFHGNQFISKTFPFVVNKAFSCEVYLKLILTFENFDIKKIRSLDRHNLEKLYENTSDSFKNEFFNFFALKYGSLATKEFLEKQINDISDVFKTWRYIYERLEGSFQTNYGFLNVFCDYLDSYSQKLILDKYSYDVNKDLR